MARSVANSTKRSVLGNVWLWAISPLSWPLGLRRAFLITLPLSVPLHLLLLAVLLVMILVRAILVPIAEFWNAPPEKLQNNNYYNYDRRRKRRRQTDQDVQDELPLDD